MVQYPKKIGIKTVDIINDYFNQKSVPDNVPVEVGIVDKQTLQKENTP